MNTKMNYDKMPYVADEHFDIIILGAGMGGLACAERLGRLIKDLPDDQRPTILVLDANSKPGGVIDSYTKDGFDFGTAISLLVNSESPSEGPLNEQKLEPVHLRVFLDNDTIEMPTDAEELFRILSDLFPEDRDSLASVFDVSEQAAESLRVAFARMRNGEDITLDNLESDLLAELNIETIEGWLNKKNIKSENLIKILTANTCANINTPASELSALVWMIIFFGTHPSKGGFVGYNGGEKVLIESFQRALKNSDVVVRQNSVVDKVILDGGDKIAGVRLSNGTIISSHIVVSNASLSSTINLIGEHFFPEEFINHFMTQKHSSPYLVLNGTIDNNSGDLGKIIKSDKNNYTTNQISSDIFIAKTADDLNYCRMILTIHNIQSKSPTFMATQIVDSDMFNIADSDEYNELKKLAKNSLLKRIEKIHPGLTGQFIATDLLTPKSYAKYNRSKNGSPYGLQATPDNGAFTRFSQQSPLDGLFFAGADTKPCGGVTGGIFTGEVASKMVFDEWHKRLRSVDFFPDRFPRPLENKETEKKDPIAIVGMACRLPGGVTGIDEFWELLSKEGDGIRIVPNDRWDPDFFCDPTGTLSGKICTSLGGFIETDELFNMDPKFFGMSPREAQQMDVQQRILLKLCWEALEDAGIVIPSPSITGSSDNTIPDFSKDIKGTKDNKIAVFIGASNTDHSTLTFNHRHGLDTHYNQGSASSILANRISYTFNLRGPSATVDTACSSSLVALHLACEELWKKSSSKSSAAIAGAINIMLRPNVSIGFSKLGVLSKYGQCRAFDESVDGYVRSEGGGIVILKPLKDALADGNRVYATIHGTAMNSDGHSISGMSNPSTQSQVELLRTLYDNAGVKSCDIDYVEAHGTGTAAGDPAETEALGRFFSPGRSRNEPLHIGSVKSNIGHLESGAGMAGLIKTALSIYNGKIPASIHIKNVNPKIKLNEWRLKIVQKLQDWPERERHLNEGGLGKLAGVNSFGFGGANASALLGENIAEAKSINSSGESEEMELIMITAKSGNSLSISDFLSSSRYIVRRIAHGFHKKIMFFF